jgi:hypothetical protein
MDDSLGWFSSLDIIRIIRIEASEGCLSRRGKVEERETLDYSQRCCEILENGRESIRHIILALLLRMPKANNNAAFLAFDFECTTSFPLDTNSFEAKVPRSLGEAINAVIVD